MKSKTTTAVLLSLLAVAGLAVNDAYAQSNTERLVSIDAATESIKGTVEGLADDTDVLSAMVSAIQDALSGIMSAVTGVQASVDGVATDIAQMNSKIDGIEATLAGLSGLDDRLAGIDGRIDSLAGDDGTDDQILQVLTATVTSTNDRLENVINRLDAIQAGLESANIKIAEIEKAPATPRPGNILLEGESELNVDTYDYLKHGDATTNRGTDFYELDMTFSCNKDVFVDKVELVLVPDNDYMSRGNNDGTDASDSPDFEPAWSDMDNNYVKVNKRDLYNNKLPVGGNSYAVYHRIAEFNNYAVEAGDTLKFESLLYEGLFGNDDTIATGHATDLGVGDWVAQTSSVATVIQLVNGSERNDNRGLYELNVDWFSYESGTTCSIGFGSASGVVAGLTKSATLTYGATTDPADEDKILKNFSDEIDCGGNPAEITDITVATAGDWRLAGFANVVLTLGDEDGIKLTFDSKADQAVFTNLGDVLPLSVGTDDLVVSGTIPVENLLVSIKYDTVPDAECTAIPGTFP